MALVIPSQFNLASYFLDRPAEEHPDRIAIAGEPDPVCYGELRRLANQAGNALLGLGCGPGARVLIVLPDSPEFIASFFGAVKVGSIAVPVNPMTRATDYAYYLADSGAQVAIVNALALGEFLQAAENSELRQVIVVGSAEETPSGPGHLRWEDVVLNASGDLSAYASAATDSAFFLYTSGSGGRPKAAIHQHKDMLVTSQSFAQGVLGLREDDRTFSVSKLFFAYGLGNGMYFPLSVGATTILNPERPRAEKVLEMVIQHRPTVFFSVPTFYASLLRAVAHGAAADFSSVRLAVSAGEWLPPEIFSQFKKRFGLEILDGIGSTEMLHMFLSSRPGDVRPGSCGVEIPNYEARIVDENGIQLPRGEVGSLWVRGQSAFSGYWNKPELTERTKRQDWVVTGDQFFQGPEGYFHYFGRTDDMMKVAGLWVSPGEVENALLGHPGVAEAAVVSAITVDGLTRAKAFVVLQGGIVGGRELEQEIYEFVRARLVSYKCPQEIEFVGELPKTATGKIQRYRLRGPAGQGSG